MRDRARASPSAQGPEAPARGRAGAHGLSRALLGHLAGAGLVAEPRGPLKSRRCFFSSGRGRHY